MEKSKIIKGNKPSANPVKQKNIQEANQQLQITTSTRNHISRENEFADNVNDNDKPGSLKDIDSAAKQNGNKNIAKGYL